MNRRNFLSKLVIGTTGLAIAAHVPASFVFEHTPKPYLNGSVSAYLTKMYNDFYKTHKRAPKYIEGGRKIFQAFEGEIQALQRFTTDDHPGFKTMAFKTARFRMVGEGWDVKMFAVVP